jgi:hypothetical protein
MNIPHEMRDEEILLTGLCRLDISEARIKKLAEVIPLIKDWSNFMSSANAHGVEALAYHNIEKHNLSGLIPTEVRTYLRNSMMKSLARNEFNSTIIHEALVFLNKENIKTVLLKGMALELTVYGNAGLRQMSDVDVLIAKEECIKARDILVANGFVSMKVKSPLHKLIIGNLGKHLPSLIKDGASVEIHHGLFGIKNTELTNLFYNTSYASSIKGEKAFIPQPQIFFLYLVRHLTMHEMNNESQLRLYTDLVVLIDKYGDTILNRELLKYASEAGMNEVLASRLKILKDIWEIMFPPEIDDFITQWHDPLFIERFIFFLKSPKRNLPADKASNYNKILDEIPGLHRKALYVAGDIFPSIRFMKNRYNCKTGWKALLYYPHRLGKLLFLFKGKSTL